MLRRALALAVLLVASPARAEPPARPAAQLVFSRDPSATRACPDQVALREAVLQEMGEDPFQPEAPRHVTALIQRRKDGRLAAELSLSDGAGRTLWENNKLSVESDCRLLVRAMGLAIAIALEPETAPEPPPKCPPLPPLPPPLPPPPPPLPPPPPRRPSGPVVWTGAGALLGLKSTVTPFAGGVFLLVNLRWPDTSIALEGRAVLPGVGEAVSGARVGTSYFSAVIAPCVHRAFFFGCGLVDFGALHVSGPNAPAEATTFFLAGAGVRGGVEVGLSTRFSLRVSADLQGTLTVRQLVLPDSQVWIPPLLVGVLGLGALVRF